MPRRRGSRKIALDVLYEHDVSGAAAGEVLDRYRLRPAFEFAAILVEGVMVHLAEIDTIIATYSESWALDRMPVIDRNLLRIGIFEIRYLEDVPHAVTIDEAVELAKTYSTPDSGRFVNGVLAAVAADDG